MRQHHVRYVVSKDISNSSVSTATDLIEPPGRTKPAASGYQLVTDWLIAALVTASIIVFGLLLWH